MWAFFFLGMYCFKLHICKEIIEDDLSISRDQLNFHSQSVTLLNLFCSPTYLGSLFLDRPWLLDIPVFSLVSDSLKYQPLAH